MLIGVSGRVVQSFHKMGPAPEAPQNLTEPEEQVLRLLAQGYIYKEIGDTLGISLEIVRTHIRKTSEKPHVRTRHRGRGQAAEPVSMPSRAITRLGTYHRRAPLRSSRILEWRIP